MPVIPASIHAEVLESTNKAVLDKYLLLKTLVVGLPSEIAESMKNLKFETALKSIWNVIDHANKYIEETAPWSLAKARKKEELRMVMAVLGEVLKCIAQSIWPFMPHRSEVIWAQLGLPGSPNVKFDGKWGSLKEGVKIAKGAPLFPRIETEKKPQ